jgi:hypothetical protein
LIFAVGLVEHHTMLIATTRFNDKTFSENERWRSLHNWSGCIYGTPDKIAPSAPDDCRIIVIEMNNTKPEKIMGFGLIINHIRYDIKTQIYSDDFYNNYIYRSFYRIDRRQIKNTKMLTFLEEILFRGKTHFKRGSGITLLPFKRKNNFLVLPANLIRRLVEKDIKKKHSKAKIIKKFCILRIQLTQFCNTLFKKGRT